MTDVMTQPTATADRTSQIPPQKIARATAPPLAREMTSPISGMGERLFPAERNLTRKSSYSSAKASRAVTDWAA